MDLRHTEGDIDVSGGVLSFVTDAEAVRQDIEMHLRTWQGESVADLSVGMPYLQVIFVPGTTLTAIRFIAEDHIRAREGVADVLELATTLDGYTRELEISGRVRLTDETAQAFGPVEVSA